MGRAKSPTIAVLALLGALLLAPEAASPQAYVGGYVGPVFLEDAEVRVTDEFRGAVFNEALDEGSNISQISIPVSGFEFKDRPVVGGRAGVWLRGWNLPYLGLEAEVYGGSPNLKEQTVNMRFIQTIDGASSDDTAVFEIEEVDLNTVTVGLNLLARWPEGRIQPYGGVGLALIYAQVDDINMPASVTVTSSDGTVRVLSGADFSSEFNVTGDDVENLFVRHSDFVPGLQLMGGVRLFILENLAVFGEYKHVTTEIEFRDFEMDYDAGHIFGGFEYYFGPGFVKKDKKKQ